MGAAEGGGLGRRPYHLERNKEIYDAEAYATYRALKTLEQREESGHQYTIFSDSASAADHIRSNRGPRQRLAVAIHEVGGRTTCRNNTAAIRWTPAHHGGEGNEAADTWAKAAAEGRPPEDDPS